MKQLDFPCSFVALVSTHDQETASRGLASSGFMSNAVCRHGIQYLGRVSLGVDSKI